MIVVELDMPPSVNKLYIKRRGGGIALSPEANRYREHVKKTLAKKMVDLSVFHAEDPEAVYYVGLYAFLNGLENPGWFEFYEKDSFYTKDSKEKDRNGQPKHKKGELKSKKGERKAKTRYKRIDIDNRVKFVQDCVINCLGIPGDEQVFEGTQRKNQTSGPEKMVVVVRQIDRAQFFPEERK